MESDHAMNRYGARLLLRAHAERMAWNHVADLWHREHGERASAPGCGEPLSAAAGWNSAVEADTLGPTVCLRR
jgi:hypothetical protein